MRDEVAMRVVMVSPVKIGNWAEQIANAIIVRNVLLILVAIFICDNYGNAAPVFGVVPDAADLRNVDLPLYTKTLYGTGHGSDDSWNRTAFNIILQANYGLILLNVEVS